ncbi:MAG: mersacidin/lichenicidin family type 2 lantibiotic [Planctomycetota bacterium]
MSKIDIIRAWKDQTYFDSLSAAERAQLPANPAGLVELSDARQKQIAGGWLSCVSRWFHCHTSSRHNGDVCCCQPGGGRGL